MMSASTRLDAGSSVFGVAVTRDGRISIKYAIALKNGTPAHMRIVSR